MMPLQPLPPVGQSLPQFLLGEIKKNPLVIQVYILAGMVFLTLSIVLAAGVTAVITRRRFKSQGQFFLKFRGQANLDSAKAYVERIDDPEKKVPLLIEIAKAQPKPERSKTLKQAMEGQQTYRSLAWIAAAHANGRDLAASQQIFQQAISLVDQDSMRRKSQLLWIAETRAICGDLEGAITTANLTSQADDFSFFTMGINLAKRGDMLGACAMALQIQSEPSKSQVFYNIVEALVKVRNREGAKNLLNQIEDPYYKVLAMIAISAAEEKCMEEKLEVALDVVLPHEVVWEIFSRLDGQSLFRSLLVSKAFRSHVLAHDGFQKRIRLDCAKSFAEKISSDKTKVLAIAKTEVIWGYRDKARELLRGASPTELIALTLAEMGFFQDAKQMAGQIASAHNQSQSLRAIAKLEANENILEALNTASQISLDLVKEKAMGELAVIKARQGDISGAKRIAENLLETDALIEIALIQIEKDDLQRAEKTARLCYPSNYAFILARIAQKQLRAS